MNIKSIALDSVWHYINLLSFFTVYETQGYGHDFYVFYCIWAWNILIYKKQMYLILALERLHPKVLRVTSIRRQADEMLRKQTYFYKWRFMKRTDQKCKT
jgi:hypothetical protein